VTPISAVYHHLVVDDMTHDKLTDLRGAGYIPALIQRSSTNNMQAVLVVPKIERVDEQTVANRVVVALNKRYGDPKLTGVRHAFRLAGFWNKKEGKGNPSTTVFHADPVVCRKATRELAALRNAVVVLASPGARGAAALVFASQVVEPILNAEPDPEAVAAYHRFRDTAKRFCDERGFKKDQDKLNYQVALNMLGMGYAADAVVAAMLAAAKRTRKDFESYIVSTVRMAALKRAARKKGV
jgi:hypothetical protein